MAGWLTQPRTGERNYGDDLGTRDGSYRAGHVGIRRTPQPAGIQGGTLAVYQSSCLGLAYHSRQGGAPKERGAVWADREGFRRRARHAARALGRRIRLWRSAGAAEPHAADLP